MTPRLKFVVSLALASAVISSAYASAKPEILYSTVAPKAQIAKTKHGLRLTVPAKSPTTWFTDRPARSSGATTIGTLVSIWDASGFKSDPPNAALILHRNGKIRTHVVELTAPRTSGSRVSFRLRPQRNAVEAGRSHQNPLVPGSYGSAEMFIDDAAVPPCGAAGQTAYGSCLIAGRPGATTGYGRSDVPVSFSACVAETAPSGLGNGGSTAITQLDFHLSRWMDGPGGDAPDPPRTAATGWYIRSYCPDRDNLSLGPGIGGYCGAGTVISFTNQGALFVTGDLDYPPIELTVSKGVPPGTKWFGDCPGIPGGAPSR